MPDKLPEIGIMQGRLSPDEKGLFQFFPENWFVELNLAKLMGFDSVEWLFDWRDWEKNPILYDFDIVSACGDYHRITIYSICADYFMKHGFVGKEAEKSLQVLKQLVSAAQYIGAKVIVIPFLEEFTIHISSQKREIVENISIILGLCRLYGVKLAFETELNAEDLKQFIGSFNSVSVGVCYDIGNATSYGFQCPEDIEFLRKLIFEVHIKDRKVGSSQSVYLGEGDADFDGCFKALKNIGFSGPYILQAFRGQNYLDDAKKQLQFVKDIMGKIQKEEK